MSRPLFEIERKFLIRYPDTAALREKCTRELRITQSYLKGTAGGVSRRVRKSEERGAVTYEKNEKRRVNSMRRLEYESEISAEEYARLLLSSDPERRTIMKNRFCVPSGGLTAEIDVFDGITDYAVCEIELNSEDAPFTLPDCVEVIREVTDDPRFTNAAMAKKAPRL